MGEFREFYTIIDHFGGITFLLRILLLHLPKQKSKGQRPWQLENSLNDKSKMTNRNFE